MGILADFHLSLPVPLVDVLYQMLPLIKHGWFFYKYKRVLDAIGECLLQPMAECVISAVDLAQKCIEINKEISELLVGPHAERVEFGLRSGFRIRHSMDGVLFCAGSLDGLWLIHDNYPGSIPLFYIVWDTLRNLT